MRTQKRKECGSLGDGQGKGEERSGRQMKGRGFRGTHDPQELDLPWVFSASTGPWSQSPGCVSALWSLLCSSLPLNKESFWPLASLMEFLLGCIKASPFKISIIEWYVLGKNKEPFTACVNTISPIRGSEGRKDAHCPTAWQGLFGLLSLSAHLSYNRMANHSSPAGPVGTGRWSSHSPGRIWGSPKTVVPLTCHSICPALVRLALPWVRVLCLQGSPIKAPDVLQKTESNPTQCGLHLPGQEGKGRPTKYVFKYLKVISQANKLLTLEWAFAKITAPWIPHKEKAKTLLEVIFISPCCVLFCIMLF